MATYLDLKKDLIKLTGHPEWVVDVAGEDWDDTTSPFIMPAKHYLNEANKMLARTVETPKDELMTEYALVADDTETTLSGVRYIQYIELATSSSEKIRLIKTDLEQLNELYDAPMTGVATDVPKYWAISEQGDTLITMPPSNGAYTLQVYAAEYPAELTDDTDETWWSTHHPEILLTAARSYVELHLHRNQTGQNLYLNEAIRCAREVYFDKVYSEVGILPPDQARALFT